MDASQFLQRRRADARFQNERRVTGVVARHSTFDAPNASSWYNAPRRNTGLKRTVETFAMKKGKDGKMKLTDGETSDGSDSGVCWSDYERVPGTEQGAKGSCRPKGSKKKKKKKESSD
tara:strand:+ start:1266 stop:1619 length:354 start_codon:yes stop_codon:yes gene_type:complete